MNKEILKWLEKEIRNKETLIDNYRKYTLYMHSDVVKTFITTLQNDIKILETVKKDYENNEEVEQKQVLDDTELKYLKFVLRPFKDEIKSIHKYQCSLSPKECINIELENDLTRLPYFQSGTMYKGMEVEKEYTLKELGIEYDK